jgi:hypothetical protein
MQDTDWQIPLPSELHDHAGRGAVLCPAARLIQLLFYSIEFKADDTEVLTDQCRDLAWHTHLVVVVFKGFTANLIRER